CSNFHSSLVLPDSWAKAGAMRLTSAAAMSQRTLRTCDPPGVMSATRPGPVVSWSAIFFFYPSAGRKPRESGKNQLTPGPGCALFYGSCRALVHRGRPHEPDHHAAWLADGRLLARGVGPEEDRRAGRRRPRRAGAARGVV